MKTIIAAANRRNGKWNKLFLFISALSTEGNLTGYGPVIPCFQFFALSVEYECVFLLHIFLWTKESEILFDFVFHKSDVFPCIPVFCYGWTSLSFGTRIIISLWNFDTGEVKKWPVILPGSRFKTFKWRITHYVDLNILFL